MSDEENKDETGQESPEAVSPESTGDGAEPTSTKTDSGTESEEVI